MTSAANAMLTPEDRSTLLHVVRTTLAEYLSTRTVPSVHSTSPALQEKRGAFVTLHRIALTNEHRELRGCIGTFESELPLVKTIQRMAISAATADPRFSPVRSDELAHLQIEISVLSSLFPIQAANIDVGVHGLCISRGWQRGVLLPQVAVEHDWDRETFLAHTCLKAGLPREAWKRQDTLIEAFTADVFGESSSLSEMAD